MHLRTGKYFMPTVLLPRFIHPSFLTIHIWWESRSASHCLFSLLGCPVSANSGRYPSLIRKRERERKRDTAKKLNHFSQLRKPPRPSNCKTFASVELIKSTRSVHFINEVRFRRVRCYWLLIIACIWQISHRDIYLFAESCGMEASFASINLCDKNATDVLF